MPPTTRILQVSAGFAYTWSGSAAPCDKVSSITLNGGPVDIDALVYLGAHSPVAPEKNRITIVP